MEWTDEEAEKYIGYHRQHGADLADYYETAGYTLSLWRYPAENIYEVSINYRNLDFTDPVVQKHRYKSVTGYMPTHQLQSKLGEWLNKYGHLAMGSSDLRKVEVYKRIFARLGRVVDVEQEVPGGGRYFFVITWDKDVMSRINLVPPTSSAPAASSPPVTETLSSKDLLDDLALNYSIVNVGDQWWDIQDLKKGEEVGRVYQEKLEDMPPDAHPSWREHPFLAFPSPPRSKVESFKTFVEAVTYVVTVAQSFGLLPKD